MRKKLKSVSFIIGIAIGLSSSLLQTNNVLKTAAYNSAPTSDVYRRTPEQISITISDDPSKLYVTFTTIDLNMKAGEIVINEEGKQETRTFPATLIKRNVANSSYRDATEERIKQKLFYEITIDNLKENTNYEYVCYAKDNTGVYPSKRGDFWSQLSATANENFEFIYISDPQINIADGKAATVTTEFAKTLFPDAKYLYIAGDLINGSWPNFDESQWEGFFNQPYYTYYNDNFTNQMSNYTIAAVQGNHDSETFEGHVRHPSSSLAATAGGSTDEHKLTYAFSWGMLRMIIINTEWRGPDEYKQQRNFIAEEVSKAKNLGQYTAVGLHRPLYTGGDHVYSDDTIVRRKEFSAFFADLDIDMVLQGHDHVVARGQVDGTGHKVSNNYKLDDRIYYDEFHENAPLYFVGGTASTFKAYAVTNYNPGVGDPIAANYAFLDLNSAQPVGHSTNPYGPSSFAGDCYPSFTRVKVDSAFIRFDTYMYGYDPASDEINVEPFLYDSYTMLKDVTNYPANHKNIEIITNDDTSVVNVVPSALPGDEVFVSVVPGAGLALAQLEVLSGAHNIVTHQHKYGYSFMMPAGDVTIYLSTKKSPRLPLTYDTVKLTSFGDEYAYKTRNAETLDSQAFTANVDGWDIGASALGFGQAEGLTLATTLNPTVYPTTYFKKVINIDSLHNLSDLYGISGTHRVDDGMIMYLNGQEIYRFNVGGFGTSTIGQNVTFNDYVSSSEIDATTRNFMINSDMNNSLINISSANATPIFEASSVTNLKNALKVGENILTCIVLQSSATSADLWFDIEAELLFISDEMHTLWHSTVITLQNLKNSINRDLYHASEYDVLVAAIDEAIVEVNQHDIFVPATLDKIVNKIETLISSTISVPQSVINLIDEINDPITENDVLNIDKARSEYDKLSAEQKSLVENYAKLLLAEETIATFNLEIRIKALPTKRVYNVNDQFNSQGLKVEVVKYDGSIAIVAPEDCEISGFDSLKPGTKTIIVSYGGKITSFTVEVLISDAPSEDPTTNYVPLIIGASSIAIITVTGLVIFTLKKRKVKIS